MACFEPLFVAGGAGLQASSSCDRALQAGVYMAELLPRSEGPLAGRAPMSAIGATQTRPDPIRITA